MSDSSSTSTILCDKSVRESDAVVVNLWRGCTLVVNWQSRRPTRPVNNVLFKKWKWLLCRLKYSHSLHSLQWLCRWLFLLVVFYNPLLFFWVLEGFIRYFAFWVRDKCSRISTDVDGSSLWSVGHWWCAQCRLLETCPANYAQKLYPPSNNRF